MQAAASVESSRNLDTRELEAGVQGHPWLQNEVETCLGYRAATVVMKKEQPREREEEKDSILNPSFERRKRLNTELIL